ncbi:hypothetical protein A8B79_15705 [Balneola sp. EhC07]|nr:hypothetical protein A8B79_15705 [Balneola sp. EhC07]
MSKKVFKINHYQSEKDLTITSAINYIPIALLWILLIIFFDQLESNKIKLLFVSLLLLASFFSSYLRFYRNSKISVLSNQIVLETRNSMKFYLDLDAIKRVEVSKQPFKLDIFNSFYMVTFITYDNSIYNIFFEFSFFYRRRRNIQLFLNRLTEKSISTPRNRLEFKVITSKLKSLFSKPFPKIS